MQKESAGQLLQFLYSGQREAGFPDLK